MSVMFGDNAVTAVVRLLNETPLPFFNGCIFKYDKEDGYKGEYIAVNHLPFLHRGTVEKGTVNINIHVPKLRNNKPNTRRLHELTVAVASLFPEGTFIDGAYYEFYADSRPTEDGDNTWYINLQINVYYNDLN